MGTCVSHQVELSPEEDYVACMFGDDVVFADAKNGQVIKTLSCGEGEVWNGRV